MIITECPTRRGLPIRCAPACLNCRSPRPVSSTATGRPAVAATSACCRIRLLPYPLSRWLLQKVNELDHQPAIFYFHPWEIDAGQPRVPGISAKTRFRHYLNLSYTEGRLKRLLADFDWGRMDHVFLGLAARPSTVN